MQTMSGLIKKYATIHDKVNLYRKLLSKLHAHMRGVSDDVIDSCTGLQIFVSQC